MADTIDFSKYGGNSAPSTASNSSTIDFSKYGAADSQPASSITPAATPMDTGIDFSKYSGTQANDQSSSSPWKGILNNPIGNFVGNAAMGALNGLGDVIHATEQLPVIHNLVGGFSGAVAPFEKVIQDAQNNEGTWSGFGKNLANTGNALLDFIPSAVKGLINPDQQFANYQNQIASQDPLDKIVANAMADPASYIPLGPVVKGLGMGAKALTDVAGATPYIAKGLDAVANAPLIKPTLQGTQDVLGKMFTKNYGTSEGVNSGLTDLKGNQAVNDVHLQNNMVDLHNMISHLPESEIKQIPHMIEGTMPTTPELQPYVDKWKDIRDNGITLPDGTRAGGTNQELNTFFNGRAVLNRTKGNGTYYPLQIQESQQAINDALQNMGNKGFSTSGPFNQQRTFNTAKDAIAAGFKPEMNPTLALAQRMHQSLRSVSNADFLNQMVDKGIINKKQFPGMQASSTKPFDSFFTTHDIKPTGSSPLSALSNPSHATANPLTKISDVGYAIPKDLARSAPRYRGNTLEFSSPLDKAAYIVGNTTTRSARDADFMKSLVDHTGLSETDLRAYGSHVRNSIKEFAAGVGEGEKIKVPSVLSNLPEHAPIVPLSTATETASNLADNHNFSSLTDSLQQAQPGKSIVKVNPYFIKPADEAALKDHLTPAQPKGLFGVANKAQNMYNKGYLLNPLPHLHNVSVNGVVLGGAKVSDIKTTLENLKNGTPDPMYQRALKAGALSNPISGKFSDSVAKAISPKGSLVGKTGSALKGLVTTKPQSLGDIGGKLASVIQPARDASHNLLWNTDAAIRTSLFKNVVTTGGTDAQAAAHVNKFMVDYNNLTPFERQYIKPLIPFYSWKKGNIPLQISQMLAQSPKYAAWANAKNAASQIISGQPSDQKGRIASGKTLSDGSQTMIDPYNPMDDVNKIGQKGVLPYLYNSLSPSIKEGISQGSSLSQLLGLDVQNKFPIYNPAAPAGYNVRAGLAHAINALNPLSGSAIAGEAGSQSNLVNRVFGMPTNNKPNETTLETATKLLGGFTARSNPSTDAKNQYYQIKQNQLDLRKYMKVEAKVNANK